MSFQPINPCHHPQWDELIQAHPGAGFFHSQAWARVLAESYGYTPVTFASIQEGRLRALLPVMEVKSWLTGTRGVSLPFTDFCEPLAEDADGFRELNEAVTAYGKQAGWKTVEWRGGGERFPDQVPASARFLTHTLSLSGDEKALLSSFRSSTRRNIEKARREGVEIEISRAPEAVEAFYRLNGLTRKNHGLPPQPRRFFKRIYDHVVSKGMGFVVMAAHMKRPVAGAVFFHLGPGAIYKFGASDKAFQGLRANNLVMWAGIRECAARGCTTLSLGRTDLGHEGLLQFKRGWNAKEEAMGYRKLDLSKGVFIQGSDRGGEPGHRALTLTPLPVLRLIGSALYRHVG